MKKIPVLCYSRTCGYYAPIPQMNPGKREEFKERKNIKIPEGLNVSDKKIQV